MAVARDVRRLHSVARSPVFATFAELVEGAATIQAAGLCAAAVAEVEAHVGVLQQAAITGAPTRQQPPLHLLPGPRLRGARPCLDQRLPVEGGQLWRSPGGWRRPPHCSML